MEQGACRSQLRGQPVSQSSCNKSERKQTADGVLKKKKKKKKTMSLRDATLSQNIEDFYRRGDVMRKVLFRLRLNRNRSVSRRR